MAPKGGRGGGSSGSSSGSSSSSSSSCGDDFPCITDFRFVYGNRATSVFSEVELYGQLVVYAIWAVILVGLLFKSWTTKPRAWLLQSAMFALLCSFAFLCARYGLLVADSSIPIGYRFEASIVDLLWKSGFLLLFAALIHYTRTWTPLRIAYWVFWIILAGISLTYVILSFIVSNDALNHFKEDWRWYFSDRDFGQLYSAAQIQRLKINGSTGLAFGYIQSVLWDIFGDKYQEHRGIQIKLGLAADVLAFLLAIGLTVPAALAWPRKRADGLKRTLVALTAVLGLVLSTLFQLIMTAAFVVPNWGVLTSGSKWREWSDANENTASGEVLEGFLSGYRTTVNGFPIVQAVVLPLGVIIACIAMLLLVRVDVETTGDRSAESDVDKPTPPYSAPTHEYYPVNKG